MMPQLDSLWGLRSLLTSFPEPSHRRFVSDLSVGSLMIVMLHPGMQQSRPHRIIGLDSFGKRDAKRTTRPQRRGLNVARTTKLAHVCSVPAPQNIGAERAADMNARRTWRDSFHCEARKKTTTAPITHRAAKGMWVHHMRSRTKPSLLMAKSVS